MKTTGGSAKDIDEYIASFPPAVQAILKQIRAKIEKVAPGAEEATYSPAPTFVLDGNLVHSAAFKHHIGFYPTPSGIEEFKPELSGDKSAKGSVQFPPDASVPLSLIDRNVRFRVDEATAKSKTQEYRSKENFAGRQVFQCR